MMRKRALCLTSMLTANVLSSQVRHNVRPYFLQSPAHKLVYDVITWMATQIAICYTVVPFVLLSVGPSIKFYRSESQD